MALKVYLIVIFSLFSMLEVGCDGAALRNIQLTISNAKVAIVYPMYNENICLFIT